MPQTFPNAYAYQSPVGQGLTNIAQMLLADDGGAQAKLRAEQARLMRAQQAKFMADAEQTQQQTIQARDFLPNSFSNVLGSTGAQGLKYMQGATETVPAREDKALQMTIAPTTARVQRPANLDADKEQMLSRLMMLAAGAAPNAAMDMENVAKALGSMSKTQAYDGVLNGTVDPGRYSVAHGGPAFKFDDSYVGNMVTGAQNLNELGKAKVGTERAHQGAYGAQANASNANARESNRTNQLMTIPNPFDGGKTQITVPARTYYEQESANKRTTDTIAGRKDIVELKNPDGTPHKIIKATKDDRNAIGSALSAWIVKDTGYPIAEDDPELPKLMEAALASYTNPGNPGYLNPQAATRLAIDKFGAKGTEDWNLLSANRTKLSIVPESQRVENQGTPTPAPAPAASGPVRVNTPADAAKLTPGTQYTTPDGRLFVR